MMLRIENKGLIKNLIITWLLFFAAPALADKTYSIEDHMPVKKFKEAGLDKLSPEEIESFNSWFNEFIQNRADSKELEELRYEEKRRSVNGIFGNPEKIPYKIQKINGKVFEINNREFEIIRGCKGFKEGDMVKFIKGSVRGLCDTATFIHTESKARCQVSCDDF